jgi:hypothetical protein
MQPDGCLIELAAMLLCGQRTLEFAGAALVPHAAAAARKAAGAVDRRRCGVCDELLRPYARQLRYQRLCHTSRCHLTTEWPIHKP